MKTRTQHIRPYLHTYTKLGLSTWLATVSASGAQVTVEPLATGVSTRLVCPRSWQGRGWRTEAAGCRCFEAMVWTCWLVDEWELSCGATTVKVGGTEEIVPLNIFFLASSTCHRRNGHATHLYLYAICNIYIYFYFKVAHNFPKISL